MKKNFSRFAFVAAVLVLAPVSSFAQAEGSPRSLGLMPAMSADQTVDAEISADFDATHPPVRVTPDKAEMISLERKAATIIVGNPDHASVLMENPNLLVIVPKAPGATYLTVLDAGKNVIMQRHVIVASPKERYVRLRRNCNPPALSGDASYKLDDCQWMSVYYCPENEMCHQIGGTEKKDEKGNNTGTTNKSGNDLNRPSGANSEE